VRRYILLIVIGAIIAIPMWWLFGPRDLFCSGERIKTPEQAMALAKRLIVTRRTVLEEAGAANGDEYIAAIERNIKCCEATYGQRFFNGPAAVGK
jgi:hypothetical protein